MKILIVGGSGFVGRALVRHFVCRHDVVATYRSNNQSTLATKILLRADDLASVRHVLGDQRPQIVINASGYKNVQGCEQSPLVAFKRNVEIPAVLACACRDFGCKLVHISTDLVFGGNVYGGNVYGGNVYGGNRASFSELDQPTPSTVYGQSKLAGESMAAMAPGALIVRTGGLYGAESPLLLDTFKRLRANQVMVGYVNACNTPTYLNTLAAAIERLVLTGKSGLFHVADADIVTRYELLTMFADVLGHSRALIEPTVAPLSLMLPSNVSLRSIHQIPESGRLRDGLIKVRDELIGEGG